MAQRTRLIILALAGSLAMLAGAFAFQYIGGLAPCHLCLLQRWPHAAAVAIGLLALAVPGAVPVLPAIIVAQTLVELLGELVYVRWIARWGSASGGEESAGHSSRKHDQGR